MKIDNGLLTAVAIVCCVSVTPALAKSAKECTTEWLADKAGMQARGVTEKAYVEQCRAGAEPTAAAPAAKPTEAPPPTLGRAAATGSKSAKDCIAEWRADKAGMQARGVTEKAYVEQCRTGAAPAASAPPPRPTAATPEAPAVPSTSTSQSQKTAKQCIAEWRADKAGMQARGVTERAYVDQCRAGVTMPTATAPAPAPTPAAPPPSRSTRTATQAAPTPAPQRPAATPAASPAPAPAQQPSAPRDNATLEAGQFSDEASAKARCPSDTVVWVNLPSKVYHFAGSRSYGTTKRGAYMCEKEAIAAEDRASKTEKHP
ncbi:hypothetical protein ACVWY5_001474 [Bradyrhizobium sp. USDA 3256]